MTKLLIGASPPSLEIFGIKVSIDYALKEGEFYFIFGDTGSGSGSLEKGKAC